MTRTELHCLERVQVNVFVKSLTTYLLFAFILGSFSTSAHLVSPLSAPKGLFQRVILQSGAFFATDFIDTKEQAREKFHKFAARSNCHDQDPLDVVKCLKSKTTEELTEAGNTLQDGGDLTVSMHSFMPVYPSPFLTARPSELINNLNISVDVMFGITNDEGSLFVKKMINQHLKTGHELNFNTLPKWISKTARSFRIPDHEAIVDFYKQYANQTSTQDELKVILSNVFGDFLIACPMLILGEKIIDKSIRNVFAYNLKHTLSVPFFDCDESWQGTCHFTDVVFVFGQPLSHPQKYTTNEVKLSKEIINAWTTFTKTGKISKLNNVEWKPSSQTSIDYLHIEVDKTHMSSHLLKQRCFEFWKPRIFQSRIQDEL